MVSALLTVYKRPHLLQDQIDALMGQSVQPDQICLWINQVEGQRLDKRILAEYPHVIARPNIGVWGRFGLCHELTSDHIAVFDDDTIPGRRWLESCLDHMRQKPALYGARGVIFDPVHGRQAMRGVGAGLPCESATRVDIVGHCWFFKREWLRLFHAAERRTSHTTAGEDYHWSFALQLAGLTVMCPSQPEGDRETHGSLYPGCGTGPEALYLTPGEADKKEAVHRAYRESGWKLVGEQ